MTIGMENILHAKERMITSIFKYVARLVTTDTL